MNYKKIFKNRKSRYKILKYLSWVPDGIMLRLQYRIKMGFWPDFKSPKRFTEKLQLYKMYYHNPVMPSCVDKYEVRSYVQKKGLGHILNECYGVFEQPEDIDWDKLPNQFVMKKTTGGGGLWVEIVKDKLTHDKERLLQLASVWTMPKKKKVPGGREWAYSIIKNNRIVFEMLLEDPENNDLPDFKFFCFQGKVFCVQVDADRRDGHKQNYYDTEWNSLGVHCTYPEGPLVEKPKNFEMMLSIASKLSEDFPFVRVDLYNIQGKIYFGELTFYPSSGYGKFHPDSFDLELGKAFDHRSFIER